MQWHFHPRTLLLRHVHIVGVDAPQDCLVRDNNHIFTPLQLHDDRLQSDDDIAVRFAAPVAVVVLVLVAGREILGVAFGDFLVCETVADARVEFVQGLPFELRIVLVGRGEEAGSLDGTTKGGGPDCKGDIRWNRFGDERGERSCVKFSTW